MTDFIESHQPENAAEAASQTTEVRERQSLPIHFERDVPADPFQAEGYAVAYEQLLSGAENSWLSEEEVAKLSMGYLEALVNAMKYGNGSNPGTQVHVRIDYDADHIEVAITDKNPQRFDPDGAFNSVADASERSRATHGRGLTMMRAFYPDGVNFEFLDPGNKVTMRYNRPQQAG